MPPIDLNGYPSLVCLYLWMKIHPEFAEAMKEAEFAALAWWEDVGQAGLSRNSTPPCTRST